MTKKSRRKSPNKKSKKRSKCAQFSKLMCNNRSKKTRGCVWRKNTGCVRKSRRRSGHRRSVRKSRGRKSRGRKSRGRRRSRRSSRRRSTRRKSGSRHRGTKSPPNGIITKAWIKKACPCRDGDNCIPCPGDLKKYKDGRKSRFALDSKKLTEQELSKRVSAGLQLKKQREAISDAEREKSRKDDATKDAIKESKVTFKEARKWQKKCEQEGGLWNVQYCVAMENKSDKIFNKCYQNRIDGKTNNTCHSLEQLDQAFSDNEIKETAPAPPPGCPPCPPCPAQDDISGSL